MTTPQSPPGGAALRGLGWDIDSPYAVWFAPSFSTRSYGHTGYTGTAIWIDPETKTFLIVLTNRLHPDGKGNILPMLRRIAEVAGAASRGQQAHVLSGIDVLEAYGFRELAGRRVGLITNRSARDSAGRRTVDVLHQAPGPQACGAVQPRTRSRRLGRGQDRLQPRFRDRPADPQPLRQHDAADGHHAGRPRCAGLRHAGRRHALLHLSHDHGLRDGGRGAEPARFLRARPARPDHRQHGAGRRCSMPTSPRSSPTCRCRCATA